MTYESAHELASVDGWIRWSPGEGMPAEQSMLCLGVFRLTVTRREPEGTSPDNTWEVDLYRVTAATRVEAEHVDEAERLALAWALPIMQDALADTEKAFWAKYGGT